MSAWRFNDPIISIDGQIGVQLFFFVEIPNNDLTIHSARDHQIPVACKLNVGHRTNMTRQLFFQLSCFSIPKLDESVTIPRNDLLLVWGKVYGINWSSFVVKFCNLHSCKGMPKFYFSRSEEHTSELQSRPHLVCRLLL